MHCKVGSGCVIYDERPPSCRDFGCVWLNLPDALPEESQRPDRLGVVFSIFNLPSKTGDPEAKKLQVFVNEVMEGRLDTKAAQRALSGLRAYAAARQAGPKSVERALRG